MKRTGGWWATTLLLVLVGAGAGCSGPEAGAESEPQAAQPPAEGASATPEIEAPGVITSAELVARLEEEDAPVILDVRSPEEYEEGHIPGAINIPYDLMAENLASLESQRDDEIVVYCRTGRRAEIAEGVLREAGFEKVRDLEGHMKAWGEAELPVAVPVLVE